MEARISGDVPLAFAEKVIKEEKVIDRTLIKTICITTIEFTGYDIGERLCGALLQFFKPSEIKEIKSEFGPKYEFPYGTIDVTRTGPIGKVTNCGTICFRYEENRAQVDKIISYLDNVFHWKSIKYVLNRRINMEKLVDKCKEKEFQIIAYTPRENGKQIKTRTKAWLNSESTFTNSKDCSLIKITSSIRFPDDFYSTLSPENIIEFIRDCLES